MDLTKLALKRPVSVLLIVVSLIVFGISSITGFEMELQPDMNMPMLVVMTTYSGASPETVEELVTEVIEDAGKTLEGLDSYSSSSSEGRSTVMFSFNYGTDTDELYTDLNTALNSAKRRLPDGCGDPSIMQMNMNNSEIMRVSVTSKGDEDPLNFAENILQVELERLSGISQVETRGGTGEYVKVELNENLMKQYGLTMSSIASAINDVDFNTTIGSVNIGDLEMDVTSKASADSLYDIKNIPIQTSKGSLITISDVADVYMASNDQSSVSRYNGQENVSVSISKTQSYGTVSVCNSVKKVVEELQSEYPDMELEVSYNSAETIVSNLKDVGETLVLGVIFAMLVLFLFFGDIKASLIVGSSMPISLLATLIIMKQFDFSLNTITMSALVIAIGMMVDSSIVVLESCFRLKGKHVDFMEAAYEGAKYVSSSVIASTITTVVVYIPLANMEGLTAQMFTELAYTIVFAMVSSLFCAITIIPLLFATLKPVERDNMPINKLLEKIANIYTKVLKIILPRKLLVLLTAIGLLILSFALVKQINMELMPSSGEDTVAFSATFKTGTRTEVMEDAISEIEEMVAADTRFDSYDMSIRNGSAEVDAYIADDCSQKAAELIEEYTIKLADVTNMDLEISASGGAMRGFSSDGVEINIKGDDLEELKTVAYEIEDMMYTVDGVLKVTSDLSDGETQAQVKIDPLKCKNAGLTAASVSSQMSNALSGTSASEITINSKEYSVKIQYPEGVYDDINSLMNMTLTTTKGKSIVVSDVAEIVYTDSPQTLQRENGNYQVAITASTTTDAKFTAQNEINRLVGQMNFPDGVSQAEGSMRRMMNNEFGSLYSAIAAAVFLIFAVMAMQFESIRFSVMVMTSIPFSLIGSFGLLFLTNTSLSMSSLMGLLMLVGIVVNNGILFVDTTSQLRENMPLEDALLQAGHLRLRPILMTTMTTIISMIPMALGYGGGDSMKGMALIIIGGLVASTFLILLLLPSFYLLIDKQARFDSRQHRREKRKILIEKIKNKLLKK